MVLEAAGADEDVAVDVAAREPGVVERELEGRAAQHAVGHPEPATLLGHAEADDRAARAGHVITPVSCNVVMSSQV